MSVSLLSSGVVQTDRFADDSAIYGVDFAGRIATGDSIATASATALDSRITAGTAAFSGTVVSARVSGAPAGTLLGVKFECTTANGDTFERPIYFNTLA
jgi:hypothetical protein